jgi:hypothetical protein
MRLATFVAACIALAACKVKDPLFCDETHPCTDPSRPYCDLAGTYPASESVAKTCIPSPFDAGPVCSPGVADRCDGDTVHRCNSTGTGFESVQCTLGCDTAIPGGCRLCTPNQTACTNGTVATCDANGNIVSMRSCALGCFQSEPRCTDVDPSNGLAAYLDMTTTVGVDLDLMNGAVIDTTKGSIKDGDGKAVAVPSMLVNAPANGVAIRVFIVKTAHLRNTTFASAYPPPPAMALVSDQVIIVDGLLDLTTGTPGSIASGSCVGGDGDADQNGMHVAGSGGGGYATKGADGAGIVVVGGGLGGSSFSNPLLVPLRGGCSGGGGMFGGPGNYGGGAVQLVSRERIELLAHAAINAGGQGGNSTQEAGGGGSGGGILLEAPVVVIDSGAGIAANGGGGASTSDGSAGAVSTEPASGSVCASGTSTTCGNGGRGGAASGGPTAGTAPTYSNTLVQTAGGGGGAVGFIRINTGDGTYTKASDAIESPTPGAGKLKTR